MTKTLAAPNREGWHCGDPGWNPGTCSKLKKLIMKNQPYVKQYDEKGVLVNPIKGQYVSPWNNRASRRQKLNRTRFRGNGKNCHMTVSESHRFYRKIQEIKTGNEVKRIEHYVLVD